jgi:hypothetical protein
MVAELLLDMLPAVYKKWALIIETDKIGLSAPAQPVTDMDRRYTAAVKFFFAVRAVMDFIKVFFAGIQHGYSPRDIRP